MFVVSKDIPVKALSNLEKFGEVVLFETNNITYKAVSNHPDVFICQGPGKVVVAPNIPEKYYKILDDITEVVIGENEVKDKYPYSALYNAVVTGKYIIHNDKISDVSIIKTFANHEIISVKQGYARCSTLALNDGNYLTSDNGILKTLKASGFNGMYVNPSKILLPGFKNGFFGGTAGIIKDKVLFLGSIEYIDGGEKIKNFVEKAGFEVVELYDGPLFDGGSIVKV